jgi:hypothetical protein
MILDFNHEPSVLAARQMRDSFTLAFSCLAGIDVLNENFVFVYAIHLGYTQHLFDCRQALLDLQNPIVTQAPLASFTKGAAHASSRWVLVDHISEPLINNQ